MFLPLVLAGLAAAQQVCNNSPVLCDRRYDNVTYAGAHDSPFVRNATTGYTPFGDQFYDSIKQLDSGIRLLSGQIHATDQGYHLCHTSCVFLDAGPVIDWLARIKMWLDTNPNDVVTILLVNSDNANATALTSLWQMSGVDKYGYAPADVTTAQAQWPTLRDMISSGKRLVTYIANTDPRANTAAGAPYLLDEFTFVFENPYDNTKPTDFSCDPDRPDFLAHKTQDALASKRLPLMNHFLYDTTAGIEYPAIERINVTNADTGAGSLGAAANNCTSVYGRAPTYFLADYINVGPALDTADRLNGVSGSVSGRAALPNTVLSLVPSSTATATATNAGTGALLTSATSPSLANSSDLSTSENFSGSSEKVVSATGAANGTAAVISSATAPAPAAATTAQGSGGLDRAGGMSGQGGGSSAAITAGVALGWMSICISFGVWAVL